MLLVASAIGIAALIRSAFLRSALLQSRSQPKLSSGEPNMMSPNLRSSILTSAPGDANPHRFRRMGVRSRSFGMAWNADTTTSMCSWWGGDTPLQLTHHKSGDGVPGPPQWSPDGREIAFARCNSERDGVYTVPALGGAGASTDELAMPGLGRGPAYLDSGQQSHGDARPVRPRWSARRCALLFRNRREALSGGGISRRLCLRRMRSPLTAEPLHFFVKPTQAIASSMPCRLPAKHRDALFQPVLTSGTRCGRPTANTLSSTPTGETWCAPGGCRLQAARSNLRWFTRAWDRSPRTGGGLPMRRARRGVLPVALLLRQSGERIFRMQAAQYFVQGSSSIHSSWRTLPNPPRMGRVSRCNQHVPAQTRSGSTVRGRSSRCN